MTTSRRLSILLASPRGFCAGVVRAIHIVERAVEKWGAPVYVRHEIVHNPHVVARLAGLGAVFVEHLEQCPDNRPVIFSAHGVPESVIKAARKRKMIHIDAVCPLVSKVHREARRWAADGRHILLIGHAGHPEVAGTLGQLPPGTASLIQTVDDARTCHPPDKPLAYVTQTTLSVDDTSSILAVLRARFPDMTGPAKEDICYATTNRQEAVKTLAPRSDLVLILGAGNSSNALRLVEVADRAGAHKSQLIGSADDIDWRWFARVSTLGLSAGASAPENLVADVIAACRERYDVQLENINGADENVSFRLPRYLEPAEAHSR